MKRIAPLILTALLLASCATTGNYTCTLNVSPDHPVPSNIRALCTANDINQGEISFCVAETTNLVVEIDVSSKITVSTGFVATFNDNFFLLCAVAHELAHYRLSHIAKQAGVSIGTSLVFAVANVFIPGISNFDYAVNSTVGSAYSRSHELDADIEAVRMCRATGVLDAAKRYTEMLERLDSLAPQKEAGISAIWATHPPVSDRIAAIRAAYPE